MSQPPDAWRPGGLRPTGPIAGCLEPSQGSRSASDRTRLVLLALLTTLGACKAPGGPDSTKNPSFFPGLPGAAPTSNTDGGGAMGPAAPTGPLRCMPARGQPLPARDNAMSAEAMPRDATMFTADLFNLFKSHCGGCHVETKLGSFQATRATFSKTVDQKVLAAIKNDDPAKFMPPPAAGGKPYAQRAEGDPIVELVGLLERWMGQGRPEDVFTVAAGTTEGVSPYLVTEEVGTRMTNLGDCVVEGGPVGRNPQSQEKMEELDAFFDKAKELPESLQETDLFTLDSERLAESGVIAFAPAYPLFSDDAAKIRHIRVPRGQSVKFDKGTQRFDIPRNTRFYKTFLKEVVDRTGRKSYRKMETRLIVSRPDEPLPDGTNEVKALYGSYIWNDDETEAHLLRDPLRNGKPFRDRVLTYQVDEPKVQAVIDKKPDDLTYELEEKNKGLVRRYAIPSAERCLQCHMGSPSNAFVLGFTPLQIARRKDGEGGVYETPAADELSQLQRLIDYGVITGLSTPADVLTLERSQGDRPPRNDYELKAQAYLLGNCANCHNPRGFPSVKSPELKEVLNFLPGVTGGIFQFPLERMSPLRQRGSDQSIPMPYITPSLREYPVAASRTDNWTAKWVNCKTANWSVCKYRTNGLGSEPFLHVDAPWRSLVYRNVDTPFPYADDFVVFPRMPMHVPGFDCRAPRIMGDWMVSIPAARKNPEIPEDSVVAGAFKVDKNPQPYKEVKPGEEGYADAVKAAAGRLEEYHTGERYSYCPDRDDIVDLEIATGRVPYKQVPEAAAVVDRKDNSKIIHPDVGVPLRPHWVVTDLTDPAGEWFPRRPDWEDMLVKGQVNENLQGFDLNQQKILAKVLKEVRITEELKRFALTELPFGLWQRKEGCDFSSVPKASDFGDDKKLLWMKGKTAPAPDAPIYLQSPGATIFGTICVNCHGPEANSKGLLADAIMIMTGGEARVANFKEGLLGPSDLAGRNRTRVFGPLAVVLGKDLPDGQKLSADDVAARYMAWMALGGTQRILPAALLNIVAITKVIGESRPPGMIVPSGTPNMLQLARELCGHVLNGASPNVPTPVLDDPFLKRGTFDVGDTALIEKNGDAEMWQRICALGNRKVVRVATWSAEAPPRPPRLQYYFADAYPSGAPVLDHLGHVVSGVQPENLFPVCVRKPTVPGWVDGAMAYVKDFPAGGPGGPTVPFCPQALFEPDDQKWLLKSELDEDNHPIPVDAETWALRGAVNAGMAVFLYLDQLEKGLVKPKVQFNRCEELRK
jgi:mono/diheme cytochrome c family protein